MDRIYLDNAASTPILKDVKDVMIQTIEEHYGNPSAIHLNGREAKSYIEECRKIIAEIFQCSVGEIFFTSGATESNNTVFYSLVLNKKIRHVISSPTEHPCVLKTLSHLQSQNHIKLHLLDVDQFGQISLDQLEEILSSFNDQALVSLMYANNEIGILHPVSAIGDICKKHGALFHSDSVQAVGHFPINLSDLPLDYMSASAHKFHGPKGIGLLYMNQESIFPSLIKGGSQERNMRAGTENISSIAGMTRALQLCYEHLDSWRNHIIGLRKLFIDQLKSWNSEIEFYGNPGEHDLYSLLNIKLPQHPKSEILTMLLDLEGISASGGSACSSGSEKSSHVIEALSHKEGRPGIRFSFSHLNTEDEILTTIEKIKKIYG